jgi:hypothetical protein
MGMCFVSAEQGKLEIYMDCDAFIETPTYQTALDLLLQHGMIFITGPVDMDKTELPNALLRHLHQHQECDPIVTGSFREFNNYVSICK